MQRIFNEMLTNEMLIFNEVNESRTRQWNSSISCSLILEGNKLFVCYCSFDIQWIHGYAWNKNGSVAWMNKQVDSIFGKSAYEPR